MSETFFQASVHWRQCPMQYAATRMLPTFACFKFVGPLFPTSFRIQTARTDVCRVRFGGPEVALPCASGAATNISSQHPHVQGLIPQTNRSVLRRRLLPVCGSISCSSCAERSRQVGCEIEKTPTGRVAVAAISPQKGKCLGGMTRLRPPARRRADDIHQHESQLTPVLSSFATEQHLSRSTAEHDG